MKLISQWLMFIQSVLTLGHRCHQGTRREQDKDNLPFSKSFMYGPLVPISRSLRRSRASCSSLSLCSLKLFLIPCSGHSRARGEVVCFLSLTSLYVVFFRRDNPVDVEPGVPHRPSRCFRPWARRKRPRRRCAPPGRSREQRRDGGGPPRVKAMT